MTGNKIPEPSTAFTKRLLKSIHEGLGFIKLLKDLNEEEEKEEETPSSFMDMLSLERKPRSEEKESEISFLDLI